jgi:hypothetical protein
MSHQGEQVAVADHRSEVPKLLRDEAHALLQMARCKKRWRTDRSRLAWRGCSLKTGHISDRLAELCA